MTHKFHHNSNTTLLDHLNPKKAVQSEYQITSTIFFNKFHLKKILVDCHSIGIFCEYTNMFNFFCPH